MASKFKAGDKVRVSCPFLSDCSGKLLGKEYAVERPFGYGETCFAEDGVVVIADDGVEAFIFDSEIEAAQ